MKNHISISKSLHLVGKNYIEIETEFLFHSIMQSESHDQPTILQTLSLSLFKSSVKTIHFHSHNANKLSTPLQCP